MPRTPEAVAVASLDTHRLIITVPNGDPIAPEIVSNLPRESVAVILRALADQLDPQPARAELIEEQPLTAEQLAHGQADALAAEHPDTVESLLAEIADDIPNRRAHAIATNYLARYTRLLVQAAHEHATEQGKAMREAGSRARVSRCGGMREIAGLLAVHADRLDSHQP